MAEKELSQEQEDKILYDAFNKGSGIAALKILSMYFYEMPSYRPTEPQPYHTFFREGQRDVVGFIKEAIRRCQKEMKTGVIHSLKQ